MTLREAFNAYLNGNDHALDQYEHAHGLDCYGPVTLHRHDIVAILQRALTESQRLGTQDVELLDDLQRVLGWVEANSFGSP